MRIRCKPLALALALPVLAPAALAQEVVYEEAYPNPGPIGADDAEITPNGRYAVVRDNTQNTSARIYDLWNPGPPTVVTGSGVFSGACQDGVAVTDERAVVIGSVALIIDLTQPTFPALLADDLGDEMRDVVITPDGSKAIVRGGNGPMGGTAVYDLASATRVAFQPGDIGYYFFTQGLDFSVDTVVTDDHHAVTLSLEGTQGAFETRVTVWDLQPAAGGAPVVAFETTAGTHLAGEPHDLVISPDGQHAAVRAMNEVARISLAQGTSGIQWRKGLWQDPGPLGGSAMDSIAMTNDAVVVISRTNSSSADSQVDFFDAAGNQSFSFRTGDPHDVAVTPDGTKALVRTHTQVTLWDLTSLPATDGTFLTPLSEKTFAGNFTSFGAGMDSIALTDRRAVAMSTININETRCRVWDITGDTLKGQITYTLPSGAVDLEITPDESKVVLVGVDALAVIDLVGTEVILEHIVPVINPGYPWCDGVAVSNDTAVAFGTLDLGPVVAGGWYVQVDLFNDPVRFCDATVNSTGEAAMLVATGGDRLADNNLRLAAGNLPAGQFGFFFYGDQTQAVPFGNGTSCVTGQVGKFLVRTSGADGYVDLDIDNQSPPAGGGLLTAGSTWYFQYVYRDTATSQPAKFNLTDALEITFE